MEYSNPYASPSSSLEQPSPLPQGQGGACGMATAAMVLGIVSIPALFLMLIGVITAILAIIFGHVAVSKIKASGGALTGKGGAIAGFVLGYVALGLAVIMVTMAVPVFNKVVANAQQTKELNRVKVIVAACHIYAADNNGMFPDSLEDLSDVDVLLYPQRPLIDPSTGEVPELEYFGKGMTTSSPSNLVLIRVVANREMGIEILGYVDGSAEKKR